MLELERTRDKGVVTLWFSIMSHLQLGWGWGLPWMLPYLPGEMLQLWG